MLLEIYGKEIKDDRTEIFEYKVLQDITVKSVYISPYLIVSCTNIKNNEIVFSYFKNYVDGRVGYSWIINKSPDKRFFKLSLELKKGDILRFKIETKRIGAKAKGQILFLTK